MPTAPATEPDSALEPHLLWALHKGKVILFGGLFILAVAIFSIYECIASRKVAHSTLALATATQAADYQKLIKDFPGTIAAGNAHLLLAKTQRDEKKYDEAVATLRSFNEKFPEHPLIAAGWLSLAETLMVAGRSDEAGQAYQQVTSRFPDTYGAPIAALDQANMLRGEGKTEEARRAYETVIAQYPQSYFQQEAMRNLRLLRK